MSRAKRCLSCGHPKSHHRVGYCKRQSHTWQGGAFGPKFFITRDCPCEGYVPRGDGL